MGNVFLLSLFVKSNMTDPPVRHVKPFDLKSFVHDVLVTTAFPTTTLQLWQKADCLVQVNLRGVDTHGTNRIPSYM